jgi:hypothetical protein
MMGRILSNHPAIFTFKELHFFGTIWTNSTQQVLDKTEQVQLLSRLFCIEENGMFNQHNISDFNEKATAVLANKDTPNPLSIYALFLEIITLDNKCAISCEQTPKNMYYLNEIIDYFPDAKVINMVRDQRDVLLSQKKKWKRRFLGASEIPFSEAIRSYINYHPITTAKVWNSSLTHSIKYRAHVRVKIVKFEQLLTNSEVMVKELCHFLEIEYHEGMLKVPVIGSSTEQDTKDDLQIDGTKIEKWKKGGLTNAEVYLSQLVAHKMMTQFLYDLKKFQTPPLLTVFYLITFPIKLGLAFLLNINRMGNIFEVIKKRFFVQ